MIKMLPTLLLVAVFGAALAGCEEEGPAERAGEELDQAMEEAGERLEEAGDKIREKTGN